MDVPLVLTRPHLQPTTPCRVLLDAVMRLSDVAQAVMPSKVARLDLTGDRPKVWLDPDSAPEDINRVLIEILTAITISPAAAPTARRVPSLYLVS